MELEKAKDLMIPLDEYPHIPHTYSLCQALTEMEKFQLEIDGKKSLPRVILVFNEKHELMGKVRRRDILRGLDPEGLANLMLPGYLSGDDEPQLDIIIDKVLGNFKRSVTDVMRPITDTVDYEDDIVKMMNKIVDSDSSFLPVMKNGKVVGVARTVEMLHELYKVCNIEKVAKNPPA